jgi:hypothetical protein
MLPPELFAIRQFSAVNAVTVCVYAAFSGFFFLAVVQLQVVAGYSALAAGTALLPTTVLMLLLSARSGELGQRIGPRIPLTVGPLLCAVGMLLMTRVGAGASYVVDVLPALVVLGAGMVTLVAPLTATVLASVDVDRAGLASGINNAAARAAGLVAIAALPLLAGMGPQAYRSADAFDAAFRRAMPWCAVVLLAGAVIACVAVRSAPAAAEEQPAEAPATEGAGAREPVAAGESAGGACAAPGPGHARCHPECTYHCGVGAPPLDPGDAEAAPGAAPGPVVSSGPGAEADGPERPGREGERGA